MPLSWNEIRHRAIQFAHNWAGTRSEAAEKQTFWNEFFDVFGIQRRLVASFEEPVKRISGQYGHIDLFCKGTLLVEHKSLGQDLGKAQSQAFQYLQDLLNEGRAKDAPRYVIVSDFARIALHDLEPEEGARLSSAAAATIAGRGACIGDSTCGHWAHSQVLPHQAQSETSPGHFPAQSHNGPSLRQFRTVCTPAPLPYLTVVPLQTLQRYDGEVREG